VKKIKKVDLAAGRTSVLPKGSTPDQSEQALALGV
jgi:hypothetical protein